MLFKINYHHNISRIETLIEVEAKSIHTRGICFGTLFHSETTKALSAYVTAMPERIDRQGETIFLLDKDFAERYPEPYQFNDNVALFGKSETIWRREEYEAKVTEGVEG